ncbi:MAG: RNA-binding S4 domain-containing protein [Microthrixaceae bacterium]|nr:RNA-binding S4 domain-containing protein [Microthrixaceae bacterium]
MADSAVLDSVRVDSFLWAIRLYKTRSSATDAVKGGHVRVNGHPAKPATKLKVGDRIECRAQGRTFVVEAVRLLDKRVGAPVAQSAYVDHSPPPPPREFVAPPAVRDRGTGRPTKKERREMDRFRGTGRDR